MNKLKVTIFTILSVAIIAIFFLNNKENSISELRKNHEKLIDNHPFQKTLNLSKVERKKLRIPPNKYFEQEYILEMNPFTGKTETEKLFTLQKKLKLEEKQRATPGANTANSWTERGPGNVPGRTRAILYDPNDASHRRVFAGGVSGGLWVNDNIENASSNWQLLDIPENLAVSSITVDPINTQIMYVGTGESYAGGINGNGIWKSTNGGTNWSHIFGGSTGEAFFNGNAILTVNSPSPISGDYEAIKSAFGPQTTTAVTANLVLVNDGSAAPTEACVSPLVNAGAINGNIAVIERANCNFTDKVINAQNAGAIAVLMINNVAGLPIAMGGTPTSTINIPSIMISKEDGVGILNALNSGNVNVTLNFDTDNEPVIVNVPGIFHINDIQTWNNNGATEIFATVAEGFYAQSSALLGNGVYGLYKSMDNGNTWVKINLPSTANGNEITANDIEIGADNKLWVSSTSSSRYGDGGGFIFSSTDGTNFQQRFSIPNARRTEITTSKTNPDKIYVLARTGTIALLKTTNAFSTFTNLSLPVDAGSSVPANDFARGQGGYSVMIEVDPNNDEIIYVGGIDTFRSTNGGSNWNQISKWTDGNGQPANIPFVHADIHNLVFHPTNNNKGIIATDGGVFYASSFSTASTTASSINGRGSNYNTAQFYKGAIGVSPNFEQFLAGAQDNGTNFISPASNGISNSVEVFGGDGAFCFLDKDNQYMILSTPFNNYRRFNLPFNGSGGFVSSDSNSGTFINQAELDDNLDILYTNGSAGTNFRIARFSNLFASNSRTNLTNALLTRPPTALKISPFTQGSSKLFVGTDSGKLLKVNNANGSPNWSDIGGSDFAGSISAINFGANENEIIVTFHNYGVESIWFTENGGTTWQNKEGNFPDIPVKAVMMNPLLNDEVIIGTDLGVWRTANFKSVSPNWVRSQNGMKNVKITSFDLRVADNTVLATTYGRGFFTGQFTATPLATNNFELTNNNLNIYPTVSEGNFTVASTTISKANMQIFDMNGRRVYQKPLTINNETNVSVNLEKGVYIVNFDGENLKESHKIIIK